MRQKPDKGIKKSKYIKRVPLKYKVLAYLSALCIFTVSLLWIFQVFLLDDFYYHVTLNSMKDTADNFEGLDDEILQTHADYASSDLNISIIICNSKGEVIAGSSDQPNNLISHLGEDMLRSLYSQTKANNGEYIKIFDFSEMGIGRPAQNNNRIPFDSNTPPALNPSSDIAKPDGESENTNQPIAANISAQRLVYARIVTSNSDVDRLVLFDCALTPVDTVIETIKIQLIIISVLCILFSIMITLLFSYRISRPITRISKSAKNLARGHYDLSFRGGGCREIDELSDTLDYVAEELAKLENLQNELISNISHDLRTPLTMIGGYAEVMRDIPGENTPENVQIIIDETQRLTSLVNNLLEISRAQNGAKRLTFERFSLSDLVYDTVGRFEKLNESKGYDITFECNENAIVTADKEKISQVLYNLIGNAINYTGEDKKVHIRQTVADSIVMIEICDTGDGIEADKLPKIWQRYYTDKYHKRSGIGMGIGLSIVKDILEAHNAAFGVTSKLGAGSVFWFKLHTTDQN